MPTSIGQTNEHRAEKGRFPNSLNDLGEQAPSKGRFVSDISVEPGGVGEVLIADKATRNVVSSHAKYIPELTRPRLTASVSYGNVEPDRS